MTGSKEGSMFTFGILSYILITIVLAFLIRWFIKRQYKVWLINHMPGPKGLPLLGNALELDLDSVGLFKKLCEYCDMGEIMRFWVGPVPQCLVSSARAAEVILSSNKHIEKSFDYTFLQPWLGTGLLIAAGTKWRSRRKLLTPAFHFKILEDFVDVFNFHGQKLAQKLQAKADGASFDIFNDVALCALDVICETAMGRRLNAMDNSESKYVQAVSRIIVLIQQRTMAPWLYPDFLYAILGPAKEYNDCLKTLHDFTNDVIKTRKQSLLEKKLKSDEIASGDGCEQKKKDYKEEDSIVGQKTRLAFLDLLLEYSEGGTKLSDDDIRDEVDTFMLAGHDTSATCVSWFMQLIGSHPHIQKKLQCEIDDIFQRDSKRHVTLEDLRQMKYLENCIKETLRLFPSLPIIAREIKEHVHINGYQIPAGTNINIVTYRIHRDPEQFPDPHTFNPDRFLLENSCQRHPYAYIPFSAGPRNCIGQRFAMMELKILTSSILRRYEVESVHQLEDLNVTGDFILRCSEGIIVKLNTRK